MARSGVREYLGCAWNFHIEEYATKNEDGNRLNTRLTVSDDGTGEFSFALNDKDRATLIEALTNGVPKIRRAADIAEATRG